MLERSLNSLVGVAWEIYLIPVTTGVPMYVFSETEEVGFLKPVWGMHGGLFSWDAWKLHGVLGSQSLQNRRQLSSAKEVVLVPPFPQPDTEVQRVQRGSLHPLICVQGCHLPSLVALISFLKQSQLVPNTR